MFQFEEVTVLYLFWSIDIKDSAGMSSRFLPMGFYVPFRSFYDIFIYLKGHFDNSMP